MLRVTSDRWEKSQYGRTLGRNNVEADFSIEFNRFFAVFASRKSLKRIFYTQGMTPSQLFLVLRVCIGEC